MSVPFIAAVEDRRRALTGISRVRGLLLACAAALRILAVGAASASAAGYENLCSALGEPTFCAHFEWTYMAAVAIGSPFGALSESEGIAVSGVSPANHYVYAASRGLSGGVNARGTS